MLEFEVRSGGTPDKDVPVDVARLGRAAWAFTTRRVPHRTPWELLAHVEAPQAGDLVLARVEVIGHHGLLQLVSGRRKTLFVGDEIVVAYGNRYAPNQFEALVPATLGPCHLVAGGGIAAKAVSWHHRIVNGPTQITPLGLLAEASGTPVNLRAHALRPVRKLPARCPATVAVVGSAMNSGKTQTATYLVKGLTYGGLRVGYAKITGTGAGGDTWLLKDAGADPVLDFTDAGLASTYRVAPAEIEQVLVTLVGHLRRAGVDAVVLELADGVLQAETAALLCSAVFRSLGGGIVFAACDSRGAAAGDSWLRRHGLPIVALSGVLTSAPLLREEAARATGLPIFSRRELARPGTAMKILHWAESPAPGVSAQEVDGTTAVPAGDPAALQIIRSA